MGRRGACEQTGSEITLKPIWAMNVFAFYRGFDGESSAFDLFEVIGVVERYYLD